MSSSPATQPSPAQGPNAGKSPGRSAQGSVDAKHSSGIDFNPFPGEPTFLNPISRRSKLRMLFCAIPLGLTLLILIVIMISQPAHQSIVSRICTDFRHMLGQHPSKSQGCNAPASTWFPPTRDIYTVVAAIVMGATPVMIFRQWRAYRTLLNRMVQSGAILLSDNGATLRSQVRSANRAISTIGRFAPVTLLVTSTAVVELMAVQARRGVFYLLAPASANRQIWAEAAYHQWWASLNRGYLGYGLYFALGSWSLYIVTQQNLVGVHIIRALWKSRDSITFGADPVNADGYFGWASVRSALVPTYIELTMHGFALACVLVMMPPGSFVGPLALASYQWLISLPVHLAFPFVFVRRNIAAYKSSELERLEKSARETELSLPEFRRIEIQNIIAERMEIIRSVPTLPFKSMKDTSLFIISVVANASAVSALLVGLLHYH